MAATKRERRTYQKIFLDELKSYLSWSGRERAGNGAFRELLDWDKTKYNRIKSELINAGKILPKKGRGGSLCLPDRRRVKRAVSPESSNKLSIFVSYSHADELLKSELIKHLEPLRRLHNISTWHDGMIKPGDEWEKSILQNLRTARIILLLVSIDFINSKYCQSVELRVALDRHEKKEAVVIPIIVRACLWQDSQLKGLHALPKDGKALTAWSDRDEALVNVAQGIQKVIESPETGGHV